LSRDHLVRNISLPNSLSAVAAAAASISSSALTTLTLTDRPHYNFLLLLVSAAT
jgi:hypothetical protein